MPTKRKPLARKKSPPGDTNWLRKFYQLCGMDPDRTEVVIARRNVDLASSSRGNDHPPSKKANVKRNIGGH